VPPSGCGKLHGFGIRQNSFVQIARIDCTPEAFPPASALAARVSLFEPLRGANERHEAYHIRHRAGDASLMSQDE
jgi:hypothetical protein